MQKPASTEDQLHMRRAIGLAGPRLGLTGANPAVGCVVVAHGVVVGEAATGPGGRPHAEEQALDQAGARARGASAYVTLEPCGARSSGAASCAERLVAAGVARVVVACRDASSFAADRGMKYLHAQGVLVEVDVLSREAEHLYADYQPAGHGSGSAAKNP